MDQSDNRFFREPSAEMGLRDYFAGQALAGGLGQNFSSKCDGEITYFTPANAIAKRAYEIADVMLKERVKNARAT